MALRADANPCIDILFSPDDPAGHRGFVF